MKRFYNDVEVNEEAGNYIIRLDGKQVKTPAGYDLALPSAAAAGLVEREFSAQKQDINPMTMPITRIVNTVIDGIKADPQPILEDILRMLSHDALFYRACAPVALALKQAQCWDSLLDEIAQLTGAEFETTVELSYVAQPAVSIKLISGFLRQFTSPFAIGSLHVMASLLSSVLLALLLATKKITLLQAWQAANIEENWTNEKWGSDELASQARDENYKQLEASYALLQAL